MLYCIGIVALAQSSSNSINTPRPFDPGQNSTNPSSFAVQTQNPFLGSARIVLLTLGTLSLSMRDAVSLALRANLGRIDAEQEHRESLAARLNALSRLLPSIEIESTQTYRNLVADPLGVSKLGFPHTIDAFNYQTAHVVFEQRPFDLTAIHNLKSANHQVEASSASDNDARNIVVLAAVSSYLLAAASQTRLQTAQAQLETARAIDDLLKNRVEHDLSPAIDQTRSEVARLSAELRVKIARTTLEKDKLALTRIIGLPTEQDFRLTDDLSYRMIPTTSGNELLQAAEEKRQDIRAAAARIQAAEQSVKAASSQRLPTFDVYANAGETSFTYGSPHRDYEVTGRLSIQVFTSGRIESEVQAARALLTRRRAELADVRARAKFEIRTAVLDVDAAGTSVEVSAKNRALAHNGMDQTRRRFDAGVANVVELLQAQEAIAESEDNWIASVYAHQMAKLFLIRAMGTAEQDYISFIGAN
jgi:outer membrane protein TolC